MRLRIRGTTGSELGSRNGRRDGLERRHTGGKPGQRLLTGSEEPVPAWQP